MLTEKADLELGIQVGLWPHSVGNGLKLNLGKWENTQRRDEPASLKQTFMFRKEEAAVQRSS